MDSLQRSENRIFSIDKKNTICFNTVLKNGFTLEVYMTVEKCSPIIESIDQFGEMSGYYDNPYLNGSASASAESIVLNETEGSRENVLIKICGIFAKFLDFIIPKYFK